MWVRLLVGITLAAAALAQTQTGEVRLTITDPSGLPLPSKITLHSDASRTRRTVDSKPNGSFTFQHLPYGAYTITVEHSGFSPASKLIDVRSAIPQRLDIQMSVQNASTEINVSDTATLIAGHETGPRYGISTNQLREEASVVPGRGVLDLVDMQPGWLFEGNGVLHPRGSEYQTQFVVDGMPMEENRSPGFAPGLQSNDVTDMTVMTSDYPAEYGRKLGGVIDVNTARDLQPGFHGSSEIGGGSFGSETGSLAASYGRNSTGLTIEASGSHTDRYLDPPVLGNFTNSGTAERFGAGVDESLTENDRIHLAVHRSDSHFEVPNENLQESADQRQDRTTPEVAGQAGWDHVFNANLLLNVRAYVEDLSANLWSNPFSTPIIAEQQRGFRRSYLNAAVSAHSGHHDFKFGGDAFYSPVTEALQYQITDPSYFDPGTPLNFTFYDHRLDREQSLFAQDNMRFGNLTVSAGLRWDHYSFVVNDHAFSPRLGVAYYFPRIGLVVHGSYDRVFQTPATENLLLASSPAVNSLDDQVLRIPVMPSLGNFYEVGLSQSIFGKLRLDANVYRRTFANYADDDVFLNTGISFPIAFRSAQIHGVDVKLDLPHWGKWSGFLSYSNLLGIAQTPVTGGLLLGDDVNTAVGPVTSFPISQDQRNTARARARYQITSRLWASTIAQYGSGLPVDDAGPVGPLIQQYGAAIINRVNFSAGRVRPNFSLDFSAGADVWKREKNAVRAEFEIENLTNRLNVIDFAGLFSGTAIGSPRAATARLQYDF